MGPRAGSDGLGQDGIRAVTEDAADGLDRLIQRVFTAGVLLGNALASGTDTATAVEDAICELDEALVSMHNGLPEPMPSRSVPRNRD